MQRRLVTLSICVLMLGMLGLAQPKESAMKKAAPSGSAPDKALLQKVLDGWSTMNPADAAKFYAQGPGTFFDITPLKYSSWDEYENGVRKLLVNYQSLKLTSNDDAAVHVHGDLAWATATVKEDAVTKAGKHEMATLRWTVIWEKQSGKWLIVHDHTSEPLQ
jgi:ketosteroid isomerase-like protein